MPSLQVPVSIGELIDKITILRIKGRKIKEPEKLAHISKELETLTSSCQKAKIDLAHPLVEKLEGVNLKLWKIEDDIRDKERANQFDAEFIGLARAVYRTNDERFAVKKAINDAFGSDFQEEKSYKAY